MKNLKLVCLMALAGLFLFLGGCQKDEIKSNVVDSGSKKVEIITGDQKPELLRHIQKEIKKAGNRNASFVEDDIDYSRIMQITIDSQLVSYTININHEIPERVFNIIVQEKNGLMGEPFILGYHMTSDFLTKYKAGLANFDQFKGTIAKYPFDRFFNGGGRSSDPCDDEVGSCWIKFLGTKDGAGNGDEGNTDGSNSGSSGDNDSGAGNDTEGDSGPVGGTDMGGSNNGNNNDDNNDCVTILIIYIIWSTEEPKVITEEECLPEVSPGVTFKSEVSASGRDEMSECVQLLKSVGYLDRRGNIVESPDEEGCLQKCREEHPEVLQAISDMKSQNLINLCTGDKIEIDFDDIETEMCLTGKYSVAALQSLFKKQLDGVDALIKDPTFENCKALNCIYEKLYNSGSKMFCNNIYRFNYSDNIDLTLKVGITYGHGDGSVNMSSDGTGVVMTFAKFNCDATDHIQLAETILHESVHAKFRFDHANNSTTEAEFINIFLKYVNEKYGIPYTEHQLMIENYMEKLAEELRILNGKKYDKSYYMAWVWDSLQQYWPKKFSDAKIKEWNDKKDIVKSNNPFKCLS